MSVLRQSNLLGQQRVDAPHLRAVESSICADFDLLAGRMLAGTRPLVVAGFDLLSAGVSKAIELQVNVVGGTVLHYFATDSGTIFACPTGRTAEILSPLNTRVKGSFTYNQTNYIGLDFVRVTLDSSRDLLSFLDPNTRGETQKTLPVSRVLDYRIVISTVPFDTQKNVAPLAKVVLDSNGNVTSAVDCRNMMFGLGAGGAIPNAQYAYSWPQGRAAGGDKNLDSFKVWADAIMTRLWELGGGEYWYSPTADRDVQVVYGPTPFASTGLPFEVVASNVHWKGVKLVFSNSTGTVNTVSDQLVDSAGLTDLAEGECLFVDLDRTQNATISAQKGVLSSLGAGPHPGSRIVLAWRPSGGTAVYLRGLPNLTGSWMSVATPSAIGAVKLCQTASDPASPIAAIIGSGTGALGYRPVIAGGVSRGTSNFVGGAGDLMIGGCTNDQDVLVGLNSNRNFRLCYGTGPSSWGDRFRFEYIGSFDLPIVTDTPTAPTPNSAGTIACKMFVRKHHPADLPSGTFVDQLCLMWREGQVQVIAESDSYTEIT